MQINIVVASKVQSFGHDIKGQHPSVEDIKNSLVIDEKIGQKFKGQTPMLLVIGLTRFGTKHCLLLRHYSICDKLRNGSDLRKKILDLLPDRPEVARKGGSSGLARVTETFVKFRQDGYFPRIASGVKFVRKGRIWKIIYIRPTQPKRESTSFDYSQPQIGGVFTMPAEMIEQNKAIQLFILFKMHAANILYGIDPKISPSAVQAQMIQNKQTAVSSEDLLDHVKRVAAISHFTYVQHPVGYHVDTFKEGPALENKMCFLDVHDKTSTGRGGAGRSKFVWALLDW